MRREHARSGCVLLAVCAWSDRSFDSFKDSESCREILQVTILLTKHGAKLTWDGNMHCSPFAWRY